jgi:hypothetical protein
MNVNKAGIFVIKLLIFFIEAQAKQDGILVTSKYFQPDLILVVIQLIPNQSNRRSAVQ